MRNTARILFKRQPWLRWAAYAGLVLALGLTGWAVRAAWARPLDQAQPSVLVFNPVADASVAVAQPGASRGDAPSLSAAREAGEITYLRFSVQGLGDQAVGRATLHLFPLQASPGGFFVHLASASDWSETQLSAAQRPRLGPVIAASGGHGPVGPAVVDLAGVITADGDYTFAITAFGPEGVSFASREAGAAAPRLVLQLGPATGDLAAPSGTEPQPVPTVEPGPTTAPPATAGPGSSTSSGAVTVGDPTQCEVSNIAWTANGRLLRGGRPAESAFECLAQEGVTVIVDQVPPAEDNDNEAELAQQAGVEYINLGVPDDTAPSPEILQAWISTVNNRLAEGHVVLVHDTAGRGRMGFWDAVYFMLNGASPQQAIEDRYLARALDFNGAKIGCRDGGNGQVQALAEIAQALTGTPYYPQSDEYGTGWQNCPRPAYMQGWNYAPLFGG